MNSATKKAASVDRVFGATRPRERRFGGLRAGFQLLALFTGCGPNQRGNMSVDRNTSHTNELYFTADEKELHRQLMVEFYEGSLDRYGINSEQARTFSRLINDDTGTILASDASRQITPCMGQAGDEK